jgi:hypothetical protein
VKSAWIFRSRYCQSVNFSQIGLLTTQDNCKSAACAFLGQMVSGHFPVTPPHDRFRPTAWHIRIFCDESVSLRVY